MEQHKLDKLADLIWWLRGYLSADSDRRLAPFDVEHVDALRDAMLILRRQKETGKKS